MVQEDGVLRRLEVSPRHLLGSEPNKTQRHENNYDADYDENGVHRTYLPKMRRNTSQWLVEADIDPER